MYEWGSKVFITCKGIYRVEASEFFYILIPEFFTALHLTSATSFIYTHTYTYAHTYA